MSVLCQALTNTPAAYFGKVKFSSVCCAPCSSGSAFNRAFSKLPSFAARKRASAASWLDGKLRPGGSGVWNQPPSPTKLSFWCFNGLNNDLSWRKSKCHLKGILSDMATIVYLQKKHIHQFSLAKKIIETQVEPSKNIKNWGAHPHKKQKQTHKTFLNLPCSQVLQPACRICSSSLGAKALAKRPSSAARKSAVAASSDKNRWKTQPFREFFTTFLWNIM